MHRHRLRNFKKKFVGASDKIEKNVKGWACDAYE